MTEIEVKNLAADTQLKIAQTVRTWLVVGGMVFTGLGVAIGLYIAQFGGTG